MKYIIVSGGVLSGLGKGITVASIGLLLKSQGIRVTAVKCDMYLNIDAGTMNPIEHGEVFVTHDGLETDQDLGHYERYLNENHTSNNYLTNGQIYKLVLDKERALEYGGECVQPYHHIPPEIIKKWQTAGVENRADVVIVEFGGTVGEYEGLLFFEAARRLKLKNPKDVIFIHVGYLPAPPSIGELKSKPIQQSISQLNALGIQPDIIVCRAEKIVDMKRKDKIALASGLSIEDIISNPDVDSVYTTPLVLKEEKIDERIIKKLQLNSGKEDLKEWRAMISDMQKSDKFINIGIIGKYQRTGDYTLEDSYVCVVEALKHASWKLGIEPNITWVDSEKLEKMSTDKVSELLKKLDAIIVPQGWGSRGIEGKITAIKYARENKIPYLGLCFGMQMATIEFARNVLGFKDANSEEISSSTKNPVIHVMAKQKEYLERKQYGGTIRLGAWPCKIRKNTLLESAYKKHGGNLKNVWYLPNPSLNSRVKARVASTVFERHRHRYEFNDRYRSVYSRSGMVISGTSPDGKLVEAIELKDHPFFVGVQFHPEYLSRPFAPHPIFLSFVESIQNLYG